LMHRPFRPAVQSVSDVHVLPEVAFGLQLPATGTVEHCESSAR
jgi:hypothetical protein